MIIPKSQCLHLHPCVFLEYVSKFFHQIFKMLHIPGCICTHLDIPENYLFHGHFISFSHLSLLIFLGFLCTLPTAETLKLYGSASQKNTKPQAQIGLGCIYDVMNRMILESDCNKVKFDEMRLAEKQMERIPETIGNIPYIIIMDRGYPSTPAFIHMMDKDIKFIVR